MALWAGTSINTTLLASAFNDIVNRNALDTVRKRNGLLYSILGKELRSGSTPGPWKFQKLGKVSGYAKELRFIGSYDTMAPVANGAGEVAAATANYDADRIGGYSFDLTHYPYQYGIPESEVVKVAGSESKSASLLADYGQIVIGSWENTVGTALAGVDIQANATLGGWQFPVDDGNTYATYGVTRTDAGNVNFRCSYINAATGELTLKKVDYANTLCINAGGSPDLLVCGAAVYTKLKAEVESYSHIVGDQTWSSFGGSYVQFGNVKLVLDAYATSTVAGLLDSSTFTFYLNEQGFQTGFQKADWLVSGYIISVDAWAALLCKMPKANAKFLGCSTVI